MSLFLPPQYFSYQFKLVQFLCTFQPFLHVLMNNSSEPMVLYALCRYAHSVLILAISYCHDNLFWLFPNVVLSWSSTVQSFGWTLALNFHICLFQYHSFNSSRILSILHLIKSCLGNFLCLANSAYFIISNLFSFRIF